MKRSAIAWFLAASALSLVEGYATPLQAQCSSCATPVVAYQPVSQATVTYEPYAGWYPGKLLDRLRMRRWGYTAPVAYTATQTPYTASYVPYTASYTPYSVGYSSYSTTSYSRPYVTAYAPLGQRQVLMRPVVVSSPVVASGCTTCSYEAPCSACSSCDACSACSSCDSCAAQPSYAAPACPSCASGASTYTDSGYSAESTSGGMSAPALTPQEAAPYESQYPKESEKPSSEKDPGPVEESESNSLYDIEAPQLFGHGDRTARRNPVNRSPSVDVRNAVYKMPAEYQSTSSVSRQSAAPAGADGWHSVP